MTLRTLPAALVVATLAAAAPAVAQSGGQTAGQQGVHQQQMAQQASQQQMAQQASQQQMLQQQQVAQMDQTMQRLHRLEQQAGELSRSMAQRAGQAGAGELGARDQSMSRLCDSVATLAGDMTQTMDRIHQNLRDPALLQDREMQKDMDRLRLHVEDMAAPLEDALTTMNRIQDRLHQPGTGN